MGYYKPLSIKDSAVTVVSKKKPKRGRPKNDASIKQIDIVRANRGSGSRTLGVVMPKPKAISVTKQKPLKREESRPQLKHVGPMPPSPLEGFRSQEAKIPSNTEGFRRQETKPSKPLPEFAFVSSYKPVEKFQKPEIRKTYISA